LKHLPGSYQIGTLGVVSSLAASNFKVSATAVAGTLDQFTSATSATALNKFFAGYTGTAATVLATNMTSAQIAELVAADIATGGITGTLSLTVAQANTLGTDLNTSATVTVADTGANLAAAAGVTAAQLAGVDTIDASDNAISFTVANAALVTDAKMTLADTVTIADTGANLAAAAGVTVAQTLTLMLSMQATTRLLYQMQISY
jgi:hypothetical protein